MSLENRRGRDLSSPSSAFSADVEKIPMRITLEASQNRTES